MHEPTARLAAPGKYEPTGRSALLFTREVLAVGPPLLKLGANNVIAVDTSITPRGSLRALATEPRAAEQGSRTLTARDVREGTRQLAHGKVTKKSLRSFVVASLACLKSGIAPKICCTDLSKEL